MVGLGLLAGVLVAFGLAFLREQDQWSCVGGLGREREVEQGEWIGVPAQGDGARIGAIDFDTWFAAQQLSLRAAG